MYVPPSGNDPLHQDRDHFLQRVAVRDTTVDQDVTLEKLLQCCFEHRLHDGDMDRSEYSLSDALLDETDGSFPAVLKPFLRQHK